MEQHQHSRPNSSKEVDDLDLMERPIPGSWASASTPLCSNSHANQASTCQTLPGFSNSTNFEATLSCRQMQRMDELSSYQDVGQSQTVDREPLDGSTPSRPTPARARPNSKTPSILSAAGKVAFLESPLLRPASKGVVDSSACLGVVTKLVDGINASITIPPDALETSSTDNETINTKSESKSLQKNTTVQSLRQHVRRLEDSIKDMRAYHQELLERQKASNHHEITQKNLTIRHLSNQVDASQQQITSLDDKLRSYQFTLKMQNDTMQQKNIQLQTRDNAYESLKTEEVKLRERLGSKEILITELQREIADYQTKLEDSQKTLALQVSLNEELRTDVKKRTEDLVDANSKIQDSVDLIWNLKGRLETMDTAWSENMRQVIKTLQEESYHPSTLIRLLLGTLRTKSKEDEDIQTQLQKIEKEAVFKIALRSEQDARVHKRIELLQNSWNESDATCKRLQSELDIATVKLEHTTAQMKSLGDFLENEKINRGDLEECLRINRNQLAEAVEHTRILEAKVTETENHAIDIITTLYRRISKLSSNFADIKRYTEDTITDKQKRADIMNMKLALKKASHMYYTDRRSNLEEEIAEIDKEHIEAEELLAEAEARAEQLEQNLIIGKGSDDENHGSRSALEEQHAELRRLQHLIGLGKDQLLELNREREELESKTVSVETAVADMDRAIEELNGEINEPSHIQSDEHKNQSYELTAFHTTIENLLMGLKDCREHISTDEIAHSHTCQQCTTSQTQLTASNDHITKLNENIRALKKELKDKDEEISLLTKLIANHDMQFEKWEEMYHLAESDIETLDIENAELKMKLGAAIEKIHQAQRIVGDHAEEQGMEENMRNGWDGNSESQSAEYEELCEETNDNKNENSGCEAWNDNGQYEGWGKSGECEYHELSHDGEYYQEQNGDGQYQEWNDGDENQDWYDEGECQGWTEDCECQERSENDGHQEWSDGEEQDWNDDPENMAWGKARDRAYERKQKQEEDQGNHGNYEPKEEAHTDDTLSWSTENVYEIEYQRTETHEVESAEASGEPEKKECVEENVNEDSGYILI